MLGSIPTRARLIGAVVASVAAIALSTANAGADVMERCRVFGCVQGAIGVRGNETGWDLRVNDIRADGFCAYV